MKAAASRLRKMQRTQIPFATAQAMNKTIAQVHQVERIRARADLDEPMSTTINAIRYKRTHKRELEAKVYILPAVSRFLRYQIEGGSRAPRGSVEALPRDIKLNRFGNIPGRRTNKIGKLLQKPNVFEAKRGSINGIWQRTRSGGLKLLIEYKKQAVKYKARFKFYRYASVTTSRVWPRNFKRALEQALKTRR